MGNDKVQLEKDRLKTALAEIRDSITHQDKLDAATELTCNVETIERYFRGYIGRIPFGQKLLDFMLPRAQATA